MPSDLPKIDFDDLKKQLPAHASLLDSLRKQVESVKIPYGEVPKEYGNGIEAWSQYNVRLIFFVTRCSDLGCFKKGRGRRKNSRPT